MGEARRRQYERAMTALASATDDKIYNYARTLAELATKMDTTLAAKILFMHDKTMWMIDATAEHFAKVGKAQCQRGCAFCCRQMLTASPFEVFILATHIITRYSDDEYKAFVPRLNAFADIPVSIAAHAGKQCPMLVNNECSVYEKRPIVCRTYLSIDRKKCETEDLLSGNIPIIGNPKVLGLTARMAVEYVLRRDYNVNVEPVEVRTALLIVLQDFNAVYNRWVAGEDVFEQAHEEKYMEVNYTDLVDHVGKKWRPAECTPPNMSAPS